MRKFNIKVNGNSYEVEVEEVGGATVQSTASAPVAAASVAEAPKAPVAGGTKITSPMPGVIRKLNFADGASVKTNEAILVIEAMKMENDIVSSASGSITYAVKPGDKVDSGSVVAYIK